MNRCLYFCNFWLIFERKEWIKIFHTHARLKNKIENNSTWEDAFYQSELVKINSSWVIFIFSLYVCIVANASKLFCMAPLANIERLLYNYNPSF